MQIARWGGGPARALRVQSAGPGCTSGGSWLPAAGDPDWGGGGGGVQSPDSTMGCRVKIRAGEWGRVLEVQIWQWGWGRSRDVRQRSGVRTPGGVVAVWVWTAGDCLWVFRLRCGA